MRLRWILLLLVIATAGPARLGPPPAAAAAPDRTPARDGIVVRQERVTFGPHTSTVTTVTMPRPGGERTLMPVLPGDIVSAGTATTSSVSRRLARSGTAVAINADLFEYASGQPSGLLLIDGEVFNQPQGGRPALAVNRSGTITTSRPKAHGELTLAGGRRVPFDVNVKAGAPGTAVLYDRGWGPSAPGGASRSVVTRIDGGAIDRRGSAWDAHVGLRVLGNRAGTAPIPSDDGPDLLFQGSGSAARALARAKPGRQIAMRYRIGPLDADAEFAIGGGPILIRDSQIVYSRERNQEFSDGQLLPPDARTAVAQLADGRVVFVAADKGAGSTGLTVAEVARWLKARGAVTAMSFDSGGSTAVSINGRLLNHPSDGVERAVGNQLVYFVGNRDRRQPVGDVHVGRVAPGARVPPLSYTTVRDAQVLVTLTDPRGRDFPVQRRRVRAGTHTVALPAGLPLTPGRWTVAVTADNLRDDVSRRFVVTRAPAPAVTTPTETAAGTDPAAPEMPDADGTTGPDRTTGAVVDGGSGPWPWVIGTGALVLLAAAAIAVARRRRR